MPITKQVCRVLLSYARRLVPLAAILGAVAPDGYVRRVVSVEDVGKTIRDQVPIGSDRQQVKAFIDNLKVDS